MDSNIYIYILGENSVKASQIWKFHKFLMKIHTYLIIKWQKKIEDHLLLQFFCKHNRTSKEKLYLKYKKKIQENITLAFINLRDDLQFTDITLVSEDGQVLEAHKVILSASSPFFMNILKLNKHIHPLVYLKEFKAKKNNFTPW